MVSNMKIVKNNKILELSKEDEKSLKIILDYYLWFVSDDWGDELNETSVITRIEDLISN